MRRPDSDVDDRDLDPANQEWDLDDTEQEPDVTEPTPPTDPADPDPSWVHARPPAPAVYAAIHKVQAALAKQGLAKGRRNEQQGYAFRGIDEVYGALAGHLVDAGLVISPLVQQHAISERPTKSGGVLFTAVLRVQFTLTAVSDGSQHYVVTYGEAMDSADKATNKAMSAAYKYMAFLTFCIPLQGEPDADSETPEPAAKAVLPPKPEGFDKWLNSLKTAAQTGTETMAKAYEASTKEHRTFLAAHAPTLKDELKAIATAADENDEVPF